MQITNVLEYLENTVKRVPDKTAYANENMEMTFGEVYHDSRAIGSYLANNNYYKEPVVVFMKKHPHAITAFYGCVYGGCYYVPIDDEMPEFRIRLIFENLHPRVMICDDTTINAVEKFDYNGEILLYDHVRKNEISDELLFGIRDRQLDTDPIYIVFTSGSTGVPKGVVACHRSVIDYIENLSEVLRFNENTRFANQTPLYFDACLKELYPTLKFGATTYIVPKSLFMFPIKLVEFLNEYKINTVCWVVSALTMISAFKTFNKIKPEYLHTIAFGKLVLIKAPTEYPYWYEQWDEQVQQFADENDVDYINFIPLQNDIGLDMSQDTYDAGLHLNTTGAEKMADYFGKYLVENYNLTDYRNDSEYASIWDKKEAAYDSMKQQQYDELNKYGELKSFGANAIQN